MDKVLVEVFVPVLEQTFEIFVPLQLPMYEVLELIKKALQEMYDGRFIAHESTVICFRDSGHIINVNLSILELDIKNGSKLMII